MSSILTILVLLLAAAFTVGRIAGDFFYNYAIKRSNKSYIKAFSDLNNADPQAEEKQMVRDWVSTLQAKKKLEEHRLRSFDGTELFGQIGRQDESSHKWAVCVHGYACTGNSMYKYAKRFYEQGYHFILPDCRGHGRSGGSYMGMGYHDRLDVLRWIDLILGQDKEAEILLFGVSMGAATVMMAAGTRLPQNVRCIVEDCGYTSAKDTFQAVYRREFPKLKFPSYEKLYQWFNTSCERRANFDMDKADPLEQVKNSKVPMMFIHGTADRFVPYNMVYQLYEAANCEKELMVVEGAGHIKSYEVAKDDYWKQVFDFVNEYV